MNEMVGAMLIDIGRWQAGNIGGDELIRRLHDTLATRQEWVTLDSALSARRPEEESGVNLGEGLE